MPPNDIDCIKALARAKLVLGVVSSSTTSLVEKFLRQNALDDVVPIVVGADRVRQTKPAPDGYVLAVEEAGAVPSRCCALEDSSVGLRAAWAAGVFAIQYVRLPDDDLLDFAAARVRSLRELNELVL
jgi:beta-phosphoglucomutase-like phosphatase (HAD superfamily)